MKLSIPRWRKNLSTLVVRVLGNRNSENRVRPQSTRLNAERLEDRLTLSASHPLPWIDNPGLGHGRKFQEIDLHLSQPENDPAPTPDAELFQALLHWLNPIVDSGGQTWTVPTRPTITTEHSGMTVQDETIIVRRYVVNPAIVNATGKFPVEALRPKTYGYDEVGFEDADYSTVLFKPLESAMFFGTGQSYLSLELQSIHGATFTGFLFPGSIQVQASDNNIFEYNQHYCETAQPFRLRFGSDGNKIRHSSFERKNIPTTADVVAIYLSDGPNLNNEIGPDNDILNYTDGVQVGYRNVTDYGHGAGTYIHHNRIGITSEFHNADGSMVAGLENALDFKSGGTPENPLRVEYNNMFGYRPSILAGAGTPGYAINIKSCTSDVNLIGNVFEDSEAGIFLNAQYTPTGQWFVPRVNIVSNTFIDITNHGFESPWSTKQGSVICGPNTASFEDNAFIGCDRLEEMKPNAASGSRVIFEESTGAK